MTPLTRAGLQYINGLLYYNNGSQMKVIFPYVGSSDKPLTSNEMSELLDNMKVNSSTLSQFGLNLYDLKFVNNEYTIVKSDKNISFINPTWESIYTSDIDLDYTKLLNKFNEIFKDLEKGVGLIVKPSNAGVGYIYSKTEGGTELFIPKDDGGENYVRCYIHIECNNTQYTLNSSYFNRFSDLYPEYGKDSDYSKKYRIPYDALVEITFEDHQVVYIDLSSGIDTFNGVTVESVEQSGYLANCIIKSQRLMKKLEIYYEVNASNYYSK